MKSSEGLLSTSHLLSPFPCVSLRGSRSQDGEGELISVLENPRLLYITMLGRNSEPMVCVIDEGGGRLQFLSS